ncbi:MAG: SPOR domain-containing protein [Candidatus Rokubacteria bacterium]|nr:SPOR domain-containing protein [Candidatus Rokubacteria bacterium]
MISGRRALQARHEFRFGTRELVLFAGAFLLIWVLTFVFGVLVGREFASSRAAGKMTTNGGTAVRAQPGKKAERPGSEGRLTFYETLTAPMPEPPATQGPTIEERIVPREPPVQAPVKAERPASPAAPGVSAERPAAGRSAAAGAARAGGSGRAAGTRSDAVPAPAPAAGGAPGESLWTVQVSSFRSRALAEELRTRLATRGFDAYLVSVTTEEGRVRHRVRVGAFSTRSEAERTAAQLRAERNLNPFVTTRAR